MTRAPLERLAEAHGIACTYRDIWERDHTVSDDTLRALLSAMGVDAAGDAAVLEAIAQSTRDRWQRVIDAATVLREDADPLEMSLRLNRDDDNRALRWRVVAEDGRTWEHRFDVRALECRGAASFDERTYAEYRLRFPTRLPRGYHSVAILRQASLIADGLLIVVPTRCYLPPQFIRGGRGWGVAAQLYGLGSPRNWGSGDFSDLRALVERTGVAGAAIVGVNPLHARSSDPSIESSPYAASTRLFVDPQYLDIEAIEDFRECAAARDVVAIADFQRQLAALRGGELVDRNAAAALRLRVLELLFAGFRERHLSRDSKRALAFRRFCAEHGDALHRYALFETLDEHLRENGTQSGGWCHWPQHYRDCGSTQSLQFAERNAARLDFFKYLQWQCELQLAAAADRSPLSLGLYRDLAVSIHCYGAETWAYRDCFAHEASVGAPPDDFSLLGQDWGIAPWIPAQLAAAAYAPWIAVLRANMRHAAALRIDHVMSLVRLFWIPRGGKPADGAYVHYPLDALLGIVALESHRNRCIVIGEDLGTVPDPLRRALHDACLLSYDVLYFERRSDGDFKRPSEYDRQAIAVATTHDLPTLAGWWSARDLKLRESLGLFPTEDAHDAQMKARADDRARLLRALDDARVKPDGVSVDPKAVPAMTSELARAIQAYLAKTPAMLVVAQLEDIVGALDQTNLPGTTTQHPNWRRRVSLDALDARFDAFAAAMRDERPPFL